MSASDSRFSDKLSPADTEDLRAGLDAFLKKKFPDENGSSPSKAIGSYKWGVYAFFDYDGEPIYVGQTKEKLSTRIRRHLTNQRTDAVAMSVLDPFEVYSVEAWPLPGFERTPASDVNAQGYLNSLERTIYENLLEESAFKAVLNEKDPPLSPRLSQIPPSIRLPIVSAEMYAIRSHPDLRIARRAQVISRLAQVIAERKVQGGLRRVLHTQAVRLSDLAKRRFEALGGASSVEIEEPDED